ncbi:hypothetical protein [Streptomyces sp. YIM S03343]
MRRTTFLRTTVTATAVSALFMAGCGSSDGAGTAEGKSGTPTSASPSPSPSSSSASPSPSRSVTPPTSPTPPASPSTSTAPVTPTGCTSTISLTAADNGHTVCLTKGGEIRVSLDGSKDRPWSPVKAKDTGVLKAINAGFAVLPGDSNAAYRATGTGTARLTASRPLCASTPDHVACKAIVEWGVTVTVRGE